MCAGFIYIGFFKKISLSPKIMMLFRDIMRFCVVLQISSNFYKGAECALVLKPKDVVAVSGEVVTLKCCSTVSKRGNIAWLTLHPETFIYAYNITASIVSTYVTVDDRDDGSCNLNITASLAAAKRYICKELNSEDEAGAELVVTGSRPVCAADICAAKNDGIEYNHLSIWCSISYTSNGLPVFSWTKGNAEDIAANTTTFGNSRVLFTTTSLIIQQLQATDYGVVFECRIAFYFSNTFERVYTWNYTLPNVPRNLRIVEHKDRLECSADGDPTPTYRWTRIDKKSSMEGTMILLDGTDQTFQCTATNVFGSERKNFTITKVEGRSVWGIQSVTLVIISAILIVFGIVQLVIGLNLRKLSRAFDEDKASAKESRFQPHQSSRKFKYTSPADDYAEIEIADVSDNYCAFTDQPTAAQETQVYYELRPIDQ